MLVTKPFLFYPVVALKSRVVIMPKKNHRVRESCQLSKRKEKPHAEALKTGTCGTQKEEKVRRNISFITQLQKQVD